MAVNLQSIIDAYTKLLIIQYNDKPKAIATIQLIAEQMVADGIIFQIQDAFNIETAVGAQLDILGKYIGIDRYYTGTDITEVAFGFSSPDEDEPTDVEGFASVADFSTKVGIFIGPAEALSGNQKLSDDDFRFLLKLKIIQNTCDHSVKSIDDNLFKFFGDSLSAVDIGNMAMTYLVDANILTIVLIAIQKGVLTRPMGVLINLIIISGTYFGFLAPSDAVSILMDPDTEGFASPDDFATKEGSFLSPDDVINP